MQLISEKNCHQRESVIPQITAIPQVPIIEVVSEPIQELPSVREAVAPKVEIATIYPDTDNAMPACVRISYFNYQRCCRLKPSVALRSLPSSRGSGAAPRYKH
jgi:hypothetical protein